MKTGKMLAFGAAAALLVSAMAFVLMSGGASALGNSAMTEGNGKLDQVRDQLKDGTCDQGRTCDQAAACVHGQMKDKDQTRDRDGSCQNLTCDKDQTRDRDGSCQNLTCDKDQTRDRDRLSR